MRIKCRDYVKKIAVYKDRLAVQLPDRVIIYELLHDDSCDPTLNHKSPNSYAPEPLNPSTPKHPSPSTLTPYP